MNGIGKRSGYDFSKHEVTVKQTEDFLLHDLKKPNTVCGRVTFINTHGVMVVTGDFGNWIFCREFHPSPESGVSGSYWVEKLQIASTQVPEQYDPKKTEELIRERLEGEDISEDEKEYYENLLQRIDESEEVYKSIAYMERPSSIDCEGVPYCESTKPWLKCVFDAFDEICTRMAAADQIKGVNLI